MRLILLIFLFSVSAQADLLGLLYPYSSGYVSGCKEGVFQTGKTQTQTLIYKNQCAVLVTPSERGEKWRSYGFFSNGMLMVFNNFGNGHPSVDTGARAFYFFPNRVMPEARVVGGVLFVVNPQGEWVEFNSENTSVFDMGKIEFEYLEEITVANRGGLDIFWSPGLVLDTGFMVGELAQTNPKGFSRFIDKVGEACRVKNNTVFNYIYKKDESGNVYLDDVRLKFTDETIKKHVRKVCPKLNFNY